MAFRAHIKRQSELSIRKTLGDKYHKLSDILAPYIEALDGKEENLRIEGKRLELANREQASWLSFYDERRIELATYVKFFEMEIARVRSVCLRNMEQYPRELSDRAKDKYIDGHQDYLDVYELYLTVRELYNEYQSIVDAFIQRGYSLRNITNIRVASLEDAVI